MVKPPAKVQIPQGEETEEEEEETRTGGSGRRGLGLLLFCAEFNVLSSSCQCCPLLPLLLLSQ